MNRNTIFISHANPEDNDFVVWLTSRLQLLGYKVWVDKEAMLGGEKMWEVIDGIIRNDAVKFLLVYSKSIFQKDSAQKPIAGKLKDGVSKELNFAETISKQEDLKDFIMMMNIDHTDYGLFIGADRLNQIPFQANWAEGLRQLQKKLKRDEVETFDRPDSSAFSEWYLQRFLDQTGIYKKRERFYSNWWAIRELPEVFYIYRFSDKSVADTAKKCLANFPSSQIANSIVTFEDRSSFTISDSTGPYEIEPERFDVVITDLRPSSESEDFPNQKDVENHFKSLLRDTFHKLMKQRGMFWYKMANKRLAYFFTPANLTGRKVTFPYRLRRRKSKTKQLLGRYLSLGSWHYAVSAMPRLEPYLCFSLKNHLTFTSDGFKIWADDAGATDTNRLHSHRRAKGKRMFNAAWRDLELGFIEGLKRAGQIEIPLSSDFVLKMPDQPVTFDSEFGYDDPKDANRHDVLTEAFNDEQFD